MSSNPERGAAAVEFAILVPILITIVLGIVEFSRAYNIQVTLTNAAREGVRTMAINKDHSAARAAAKNAASHLNPALTDGDITFTDFSPHKCPSGEQMTATISYNFSTVTGIAADFALQGKGTMLCGG